MSGPARDVEVEARDARRLTDQLDELGKLPLDQGRPRNHAKSSDFVATTSLPSTAARAKVAIQVVAVRLPESRMLFVLEPDAAHPLRALPEIEVRDEQPRGAAVLGMQRLAVELVCDPGLAVHDVLERQVGGVAAVAEHGDVLGPGLHPLQQGGDRNAFPGGVELRPLGDAMDVLRDGVGRQGEQLLPRPALRLIDLAFDGEGPLVQVGAGRRTGGQNREIVHQVLAWRQTRARSGIAAPSLEPARDETHQAMSIAHGAAARRPPHRGLLLDGDDSKWCGTYRQGEWRSGKLGQRAPAHREGADGIECRVDDVDIRTGAVEARIEGTNAASALETGRRDVAQ